MSDLKEEDSSQDLKTSNFIPHNSQSLDEILQDIQTTINDLPPPKLARKEIQDTWKFLHFQKEDISDFVKVIEQLSETKILEKSEEIEQLARRLDIQQDQEFKAGEEMNIIQR